MLLDRQVMVVVIRRLPPVLSVMAVVAAILLWGLLTDPGISNGKPLSQPVKMQSYGACKVIPELSCNPRPLGDNMAMQFDGGGTKKPAKPSPGPLPRASNPMFTPKAGRNPMFNAGARSATPLSSPQRAAGPVAPRAPRQTPTVNTGGSSGLGTSATGTVAAQSMSALGGAGGGGAGPMSEQDYLAQDSQFLDEQSAAQQEYENLIAQLAQQKTEYNTQNGQTLRNLGWNDTDPDGAEGPMSQGWNQDDRLTAYGNAYQNQLNDFAGRGMLDSSLYGQNLNDLNRGFDQQKTDLATALQGFLNNQTQQTTQAGQGRDSAIASAQRQALQRYAAQQGLMGV